MAFGISRAELNSWKAQIKDENIAFLTHYWIHPKYPHYKTVTKVGCSNVERLKRWGEKHGLKGEWIHYSPYPHFDLLGKRQVEILTKEGIDDQIKRFNLTDLQLK